MPIVKPGSLAAVVCALALLAVPVSGTADDAWKIKGKLIGKPQKSEDVSGIACTTQKDFPRSCLVIDDNLQDAQFVTVEDGKLRADALIKLIEDRFDGEALELDGEGVAFADGLYYVIGSHGRPRRDNDLEADMIRARIAASSQIVRFPAKDGANAKVERTANLRKLIAADSILAQFMDKPLDQNGLTIEGVAIKDNATLYAGFRAPVVEDKGAAVMSVPVGALFAGSLTKGEVTWLKLGAGRGVRDIVAFETGLLILAGPGADEGGTYAIYRWDGNSKEADKLAELTQFKPKRKPEGLLPLDRNGTQVRVLILFDKEEEGAPTPVAITMP